MRESVRNETRAAYREAILEAAERVFGRDGFQRAKMAAIAAEAGVAAGTVYNYFKNKEEVFESILARGYQQLLALLLDLKTTADPLARMKAQLEIVFGFLEEHGGLFSIFISRGGAYEWGQQKFHKESPNQQIHARFEQLSLETMTEAVAAGQLRADIPVEMLHEMFSGLTDALLFTWFRSGCPPNLSSNVELLFDMFLNGAHAR